MYYTKSKKELIQLTAFSIRLIDDEKHTADSYAEINSIYVLCSGTSKFKNPTRKSDMEH